MTESPAALLEAARAAGGPLITREDSGEIAVTFVAQGDHPAMALQAPFGGPLQPLLPMERLPASDVWTCTVQAPAAVRTTYAFLPDPPPLELDLARVEEQLAELMAHIARIQADPYNPRRATLDIGEMDPVTTSVLEGPDAPEQPFSRPRPGAPAGAWEEHLVPTALLAEPRRVWVRTPPGYDAQQPHALLVVLDGQAWQGSATIATVLDNLVADGAVPPLLTVAVDSLGVLARMADLGLSEPFVDFLADELVPWARERWPVDADRSGVVVAGMSMGGLASAFAGLRRPDVFGRVLPLSPSLFYPRDGEQAWLLARYAEAEELPERTHVGVGSLEQVLAPLARQLAELLQGRGADASFSEWSGGHDVPCWEGAIADGLQRLLAR